MADSIQQMSLRATPFQFAQPTFQVYQGNMPDLDILNRSMEKQEGRMYQSRVARDKIDETLNTVRATLNPLEWERFDAEADVIRHQIDTDIQLGRFGQSILTAEDLGSSFARDTYWKNAAATQAEYLKARDKVQTGPYNNYTRRYWDAMNPYVNNGNGTWTEQLNLEADQSLADIWNAAVAATPTRSDSKQWSKSSNSTKFVDADGNFTDAPDDNTVSTYSSTTTSTSGSSSYTEKRKEDIIAKFNDMLVDPNISSAIRQNFNVMQWLYQDAQSRLNNPNLTETERENARQDLAAALDVLQNEDGLIYGDDDYKAWLDYKAAQYAGTSAYRHTSSSSSSSTNTSYNDAYFKNRAMDNYIDSLNPSDYATTQSWQVQSLGYYALPGYQASWLMPYYTLPTYNTPQRNYPPANR